MIAPATRAVLTAEPPGLGRGYRRWITHETTPRAQVEQTPIIVLKPVRKLWPARGTSTSSAEILDRIRPASCRDCSGSPCTRKTRLQVRRQRLEPRQQLALVGVAAQFVEAGHFRPHRHRLAEDAHLLPLLHQLAAQRVGGLEAGDEHRVARVLDVVAQVVQDAALLAHARGGDHDERAVQIVQLLRFGGLADVVQPLEAERVLAVLQPRERFGVEAFRVLAEDRVTLTASGLSDEDGDVGDALVVEQLVQQQHELLRAADGEGGDDDAAAAPAPYG